MLLTMEGCLNNEKVQREHEIAFMQQTLLNHLQIYCIFSYTTVYAEYRSHQNASAKSNSV